MKGETAKKILATFAFRYVSYFLYAQVKTVNRLSTPQSSGPFYAEYRIQKQFRRYLYARQSPENHLALSPLSIIQPAATPLNACQRPEYDGSPRTITRLSESGMCLPTSLFSSMH